MIKLKKEELQAVEGGGISFGVGCLIVGLVIFIIGVIDGYTRPLRCN